MRWLSGRTVAASHDGGRRSGVLCSAFCGAVWTRVDSVALRLQNYTFIGCKPTFLEYVYFFLSKLTVRPFLFV